MITDGMYSGKITDKEAMDKLIRLLADNGINPRGEDHVILVKSYWVYNKEKWATKLEKPLGLGLVYKKPDGTKTQDIFIAIPTGQIEKYYSESEMIKKYPSMKGVHKSDLPIE